MVLSLKHDAQTWILTNETFNLRLVSDATQGTFAALLSPSDAEHTLALWTGFAGITGHVHDYFLTTESSLSAHVSCLEETPSRIVLNVTGLRAASWDVEWRITATPQALEWFILVVVGQTTRTDHEVDLLAFEVPPTFETTCMTMDTGYIFPPKSWFSGPPPVVSYEGNDDLRSVIHNRPRGRFAGDGHEWMELHFGERFGLRLACTTGNAFFYVPHVAETEPAPRPPQRLPMLRYRYRSFERFGIGTTYDKEFRTWPRGERLGATVYLTRTQPSPIETIRLDLPDTRAAETARRFHRSHAHSAIGHRCGFSGGWHNAGAPHRWSVSFEYFMHAKAHLYSVHPAMDRLFRNTLLAVGERDTRPDGFVWTGGMGGRGEFYEGNASMLMFLADYVRRTGDLTHLALGRRWLAFIERHIDPAVGLFRVPSSTGIARPGAGSYICNWWDVLACGGYDGFINMLTYPALRDFAQLEARAGNRREADRVAALAERLRDGCNDHLWDETNGRYIGWLDTEGGRHDAWYTPLNLIAVAEGVADRARSLRILRGIDAKLAALGYQGCSVPCNLEPIPPQEYNAGDWWLERFGYPHFYDPFGIYENGGIWIWVSGYYAAAWRQFDPDHAYRHLLAILDLYRRDGLYGGGNGYCWDPATGEMLEGSRQEPYLSNAVMCLWGLYALFGIELDLADGLRIAPHLPPALDGSRVGFRYAGYGMNVHFAGHGDCVSSLRIDGAACDPSAPLPLSLLRDGAEIEVEVRTARQS